MRGPRTLTCVLVGVGANIEPEANITAGLVALSRQVHITAVSTFYWTEPIGRPAQPPYLNGAVGLTTDLRPGRLQFEVLRGIEAECGRVRSADAFASRPLDLDLAVYGDERVDEPDLQAPDPLILERDFLAVSLAELAPDMRLPGLGVTLADAAARFDRSALRPDEAFTAALRARIAK